MVVFASVPAALSTPPRHQLHTHTHTHTHTRIHRVRACASADRSTSSTSSRSAARRPPPSCFDRGALLVLYLLPDVRQRRGYRLRLNGAPRRCPAHNPGCEIRRPAGWAAAYLGSIPTRSMSPKGAPRVRTATPQTPHACEARLRSRTMHRKRYRFTVFCAHTTTTHTHRMPRVPNTREHMTLRC